MTPEPESSVIGVMRHAKESDGVSEANPQGTLSAPDAGTKPAVIRSPFVVKARCIDRAPHAAEGPAGLEMVVAALGNTSLVGLDRETTGLDPEAIASACSPWRWTPSTAGRSAT
jgi:hypothetical protein